MGNNLIKKTQYINPDTGEVTNEKVQHLAAAFHDEKGYLFWARKNFAKSFADVGFPESMTMKERGQMVTLVKHMWSNTNMLGYRGSGGVKAYNEEQIGELVGLRAYQAKEFVRSMIRVSMIAKVTVLVGSETITQYYINPIYFFGSNRIPLNLYLIFKSQLDKVLPRWVRDEYAASRDKAK